MMTAIRTRCFLLLPALLLCPACAQNTHGGTGESAAPVVTSYDQKSDASQATRTVAANETVVMASTKSTDRVPTPPDSDDRISFTLGLEPGDMLYYVIESQYRESGGVPPLLSYSTVIKDRKTISQKVMPRSIRQPTTQEALDDPLMMMLWKVERYEVTEQGMKDTLSYDSVRHSYPPPTLWELGGISGAKITFLLDPTTALGQDWTITPSKSAGESTRRPLSKLAAKCQLTNDNLTTLLKDMGPYWMPEGPVEIGVPWTRTYSDDLRTFGTTTTTLQCVVHSVRKLGDRRIARVEINGEVTLENPPQPTTRPGQPARGAQREFRIDRSTCKGTVEFDLTRGQLYTLNLHRELHLTAEVESERSGTMELNTGWGHVLKIKTGHTPPPKPIIVGGPKPPDVPEDQKSPAPIRRPAPTATTKPSTE